MFRDEIAETITLVDYNHLKQIIAEYDISKATEIIAANLKNITTCQCLIEDPQFDIIEFKELLKNKTLIEESYLNAFDNAEVIKRVIAEQNSTAVTVQCHVFRSNTIDELTLALSSHLVQQKLKEGLPNNAFTNSLRELATILSGAKPKSTADTEQVIAYADLPDLSEHHSQDEKLVFFDQLLHEYDLVETMAMSKQVQQQMTTATERDEARDKGKDKETEDRKGKRKAKEEALPNTTELPFMNYFLNSNAPLWQTAPASSSNGEFDALLDEEEQIRRAMEESLKLLESKPGNRPS